MKFDLLQQRLFEIYRIWQGFDEKKKREKINIILPFIQLVSYLKALNEIVGNNVAQHDEILRDFANNYGRLYRQDVSRMKVSDLSPELMRKINDVDINKKLLEEIKQYSQKYTHAHSRIMFNYGAILMQIFAQNKDKQPELRSLVDLMMRQENIEGKLVEINTKFEVEKNSEVVIKDDLENHSLLNQITTYSQNIAQFPALILNDKNFAKIIATLQSTQGKTILRKAQEKKHVRVVPLPAGVEMQVGIETEFLLNTLHSRTKTESVKEILADLNARRFMQEKYNLPASIAKIEDMTSFLQFEEESADRFSVLSIMRETKKRITDENWQNIRSDEPNKEKLIELLEWHCKRFSEAEIYFCKLFLLNKDFARNSKIEMAGVYDFSKSDEENFIQIISLISKGMLHEKALDMIRAFEVSMGPFDAQEIIDKKNYTMAEMRLLANQNGLSLDDANIQLNLSVKFNGRNIFLPKIYEEEWGKIIKISALGKEI